jgi:hypothetical protein
MQTTAEGAVVEPETLAAFQSGGSGTQKNLSIFLSRDLGGPNVQIAGFSSISSLWGCVLISTRI